MYLISQAIVQYSQRLRHELVICRRIVVLLVGDMGAVLVRAEGACPAQLHMNSDVIHNVTAKTTVIYFISPSSHQIYEPCFLCEIDFASENQQNNNVVLTAHLSQHCEGAPGPAVRRGVGQQLLIHGGAAAPKLTAAAPARSS